MAADDELQACLSLFQKPPTTMCFNFEEHRESSRGAAYKTKSALEKAKTVHDWCRERGVRILYPGHSDYPFDSNAVRNCPQFLSCMGEVCWRSRHLVSVIGSREPS